MIRGNGIPIRIKRHFSVRLFTLPRCSAQRALLVGRTMTGMQVTDALAAFDYLLSRPDIDPARISIAGKGNGSVLALYAAALEPRIQEVSLEGGIRSYLDLLDSRDHGLLADLVIPGVLKSFDLEDVVRAIAPRKVRRS